MDGSPFTALELYLDLKRFETNHATYLEQLALAHLLAEVIGDYDVQAFLAAVLTSDTASNVIPALRQRIKRQFCASTRSAS